MAPSRGQFDALLSLDTTPPLPSLPQPQRALQACTACKRRQVRCNGILPCQQCQHHALPCSFAAAQGRGRSRIGTAERGAVIAESRLLGGSGTTPPPLPLTQPGRDLPSHSSSTYNTSFFYDFIIPQFLERVYPLTPVLEEDELAGCVARMAEDDDAASLVYACTAITLLLMQNDKPWTSDCYEQATEMIALTIEHLKPLSLADHRPTLTRLLAPIFLEMCMLVMHKSELAFFYLRQAISMILMQGIDRFLDRTETADPKERTRRMRIYYLCFIHERHLCIEALLLVCLEPLPSLPDVENADLSSIGRGWNYIVQTFMVIDHDFARFWTGDRSGVTAAWILKKHQELTDDAWQDAVDDLPYTQQADLIITRQWLRTLTWHIATSNTLLSSDADQSEALSLFMPLRLSRQLKLFLSRMSTQAIAVHGMGIIEKLFEITTTIADAVAALISGGYSEDTWSSIHDLLFLKSFLLDLPHVKPIHRDIIHDKMSYVKSLYDSRGMSELLQENGHFLPEDLSFHDSI